MKKNKVSFITLEELDAEVFINNPERIIAYLNVAIEDYLFNHNQTELSQALALAMKWANVSNVATKSQLSRQGIYKAIRQNANPSFSTVIKMLHGAGFGIQVVKAK